MQETGILICWLTTEGAEFETVSANFSTIVECVWESLSSDDRYFIGMTYSKYVNQGNKVYILTFKRALERVHGFDYVPENLRSLSFIQAAKHIKSVHYAFNNFYNEPDAVNKLERLGNQIPKPAIKESVSACLMVVLGNAYGRSFAAVDSAYQVLNKLDKGAWNYYLNDCLPFDEEVLDKIKAGDQRTIHWCELVSKYNLNMIEIKDSKIQEMLDYSVKNDNKVRNYCKANGLDGYAKKRLQAKEGKQMEEDCADSVCRYCGKPIEKQNTGRKRIYCSEECRRAWSKNHLPLYKHECMFCGKKFESSSKTQKFCSHDCYIRDRFWRKEDTEEIVKMLLAGKKVPTVPKWIKDILTGETK